MFIPISGDELFYADEDRDIFQVDFKTAVSECLIFNKLEAEAILLNNYPLLKAVAETVCFANHNIDVDDLQTDIAFSAEELQYDQLPLLLKLFEKVQVWTYKGKISSYRVIGASQVTKDAFHDLLSKGMLPDSMYHFMFEKAPIIEYSHEMAFYQYQLSDEKADPALLNALKKDPFIRCALSDAGNSSTANILLSGFTVEELNTDEYIRCLSQIVEKLYLLELDLCDGLCYKILNWQI